MPSISRSSLGQKYSGIVNRAVTVLGATIGLAASCMFTPAEVHAATGTTAPAPKTYYVSSATTYNPSNDGSSWKKAWTYTNQINWSAVQPGDTITFDGGTWGLYYPGTFTIGKSGTSSKPIKIVTSQEAGHSGQVTISGSTAAAPSYVGIDFGNNQYVQVEGRKITQGTFSQKSMKVWGFANYGVRIGTTSYSDVLRNVDISGNGYNFANVSNPCGLLVQGRSPRIENCHIYNNKVNVVIESAYGGYGPMFRKCSIFNYPVAAAAGTGYGGGQTFQFSWDETDGVRVKDTYRGGFSWFSFYDCVFGPGLGTSIEFGQKNGGLSTNNCLFINPKTAAIKKVATTLPDYYYSIISQSKNTMFLTPLNRDGMGHSNLDFTTGQDSAYNSIYWGGTVKVVGNKTLGFGNFQNKTTGNTLVISPAQQDPGFATDVSTINANDWEKLFYSDFNLRSGAPATGKGASVTSFLQGLNQ